MSAHREVALINTYMEEAKEWTLNSLRVDTGTRGRTETRETGISFFLSFFFASLSILLFPFSLFLFSAARLKVGKRMLVPRRKGDGERCLRLPNSVTDCAI